MEEDDDFGDLYTDVLKPFTLPQSPAPQPHHPSPAPAPPNRQIDLNLRINGTHQTPLPNSPKITKIDKIPARNDQFCEKDVKFDIEYDMVDELNIPIEFGVPEQNGVDCDSDSDSEDDLRIVLNDDNRGFTGIDQDGDDEDGESLDILADNLRNRVEEQELVEDAGQEGEAASESGGMVIAQKIGFNAHPYSQFKYVRPGAALMPASTAAGSGGPTSQVRPLVNMGSLAGRGRGATGMRPPMQKGFNPGFGMPVWGAGRGFGGGLDFTLPSHKTVFEVDIDSFEEKPWKYPGVDISDFFNFGLNEETWKDYCKQLEQLKLESTMQSRIRVIDGGRTDQYDPDMPPELVAATGVLDIPAENGNLRKTDAGQMEQARGSARPPIPTGRAIQVESGYGERLPSIDTRPPRMRDSDAIIEIVCQDNVDDSSSTGNDDSEIQEIDLARDDLSGGNLPEENLPVKNEVSGGFQQAYNAEKRELGSKRKIMNSIHDGKADEDRMLSLPPKAPDHSDPASKDNNQSYSGGKLRSSLERPIEGRRPKRSSHSDSSQGTCENQREESVENSRDDKHDFVSPSPVTSLAAPDSSADHKVAADDEPVTVGEDFEMENEETLDTRDREDNADGMSCSQIKHKTTSQVKQQSIQESDEEDSRAARSSDNSKEYQKWQDYTGDEVVQDGHNKHMGRVKRHIDENEERVRRREHYGRPETEKSHIVVRGREGFYSRRDLDKSSVHHLHMKNESFDRRKERDIVDGSLQRIEDDTQSRRITNEDARKRDRGEQVGPRHRGKARESERTHKEEHGLVRNLLDNGPYRAHYDRDVGSRQRERDGSMKSRYEMDDYHSKKRKDEDYIRRDYIDKEEIWHGHRENISRRNRDRDDIVHQWTRDGPPRNRDNLDDQESLSHREEGWLQRERGDRRERDEWHKLKQVRDENILKREKEEERASMRNGRAEDKGWGVHARTNDEYRSSERGYQFKDSVRHGEHHRGRNESYAHGNHINHEEKRSRHDRSNSRNDHVVEAFDNPRGQGKRHKENFRKDKEPESGTCKSTSHPQKNEDDQSVRVTETVKGQNRKGNGDRGAPLHCHPSRKQKDEEASDDDDHQDKKRGRSKFERWTSHNEIDFIVDNKSSSSLKFKEIGATSTGGSSKSDKVPDEAIKSVVAFIKEHSSSGAKDTIDPPSEDADKIPLEDKHPDTVIKLKKRSECFKLSMASEKETKTVKKIETDAVPTAKCEAPADPEIIHERSVRKRRWTGN